MALLREIHIFKVSGNVKLDPHGTSQCCLSKSISSSIPLLIEFTPCQAEQPLGGVQLQEKERQICLERSYS